MSFCIVLRLKYNAWRSKEYCSKTQAQQLTFISSESGMPAFEWRTHFPAWLIWRNRQSLFKHDRTIFDTIMDHILLTELREARRSCGQSQASIAAKLNVKHQMLKRLRPLITPRSVSNSDSQLLNSRTRSSCSPTWQPIWRQRAHRYTWLRPRSPRTRLTNRISRRWPSGWLPIAVVRL